MKKAEKEGGVILGRSFEMCVLWRSLAAMPVGASSEHRSSLAWLPSRVLHGAELGGLNNRQLLPCVAGSWRF